MTPVLEFDVIDSTMLEAERLAEAGNHGPVVIWARSQTGGLGRHGRAWSSPPGNLYWTMLLPRSDTWPRDHGLSFAAGLCVCDVLAQVGVTSDRVRLKWPNDCLLDGRKVSGVLARSIGTTGAGRLPCTIVGIGVNVISFPEDAFFPAGSLATAGLEGVLVTKLRDLVTLSFLARLGQWERSGYEALRADVEDRLHGRGLPARVAMDRDRTVVVEGVNEGLDAKGALRLRLDDGTERLITAGDVLPPI